MIIINVHLCLILFNPNEEKLRDVFHSFLKYEQSGYTIYHMIVLVVSCAVIFISNFEDYQFLLTHLKSWIVWLPSDTLTN